LGIINVDFNATGQLPIIYCQILEKIWEYSEVVYQLFIDFNKAYDSVRREVLYNVLIEFGIPIKVCLCETYTRVRVDKNLTCFQLGIILNKEKLYRRCFSPLL
jgi:hypothetical protein